MEQSALLKLKLVVSNCCCYSSFLPRFKRQVLLSLLFLFWETLSIAARRSTGPKIKVVVKYAGSHPYTQARGLTLFIFFFFFHFYQSYQKVPGPYSRCIHIPPNGDMNGRGKMHVSLIVTQEIQNHGVFRKAQRKENERKKKR